MSAKIIPFGIIVNPIPHSDSMLLVKDNAEMDYEHPTVQGQVLAKLTLDKGWKECFWPDGRLNRTRLAAKLTDQVQGRYKKIHQSTLDRIYRGDLSGKPATLAPIAAGFGMDTVAFIAMMNPEMQKAAVSALPPAAEELWRDWERLPKAVQEMHRQQMKTFIENAERYPDLAAIATRQAGDLADKVRTDRLRSRRKA